MREEPLRGWVAYALVAAVLVYAGLLLIAPIGAVVFGAFARGVQPLLEAITDPQALAALRLTFMVALIVVAINTVLGIIVAWVLVRHDFPGKGLFNALVDLPFVVSPVIVGYVMVVLFGRAGWFSDFPIQLAFSTEAIVLVTLFVSLPFVVREVQPVLASLTSEQEEAAYTLRASRWTVFWRVVFPAIRYAVIYGIVLTLARALGEFGAAAVAGGGVEGVTETATIYVYRAMHDRNPIGAYGMAVVLGLIAVGILVIMNRLKHNPAGGNHVDHS